MTLGEKICKLHTTNKMSQGDLAEKLNVSRQSISKWETNASVPELDKLIQLSDLFGISLDDLVRNEELEAANDREEVFNDILVRVWDRVDQFDPAHGNWSNWLSTIARNAAIDRAKRNPPAGAELNETIPAPNSDPEQVLLRKERQRALHIALNSLESSDKALFYRKYYYRQSTAQIAAEYGTTERAIEGRLYRIKRKLRKVLGGDFYDG